jgi:ABC-type Fe3+ transport system permease subunit
MFQALLCSSSGSTVHTTIGIFCAYYVSWLLHSNRASSQLTQYAQNIPTVVYAVPPDD